MDFNLEEAWPQETDRQQFYYLERETRKLEEIAWSDRVVGVVSVLSGLDISTLRESVLSLSQPAEAGWHFYADDRDPGRAESMAAAWAQAFTTQAQAQIAAQGGPNSFIRIDPAQVEDLPVYRRVSLGACLLTGSAGFLALCSLLVLFVKPRGA